MAHPRQPGSEKFISPVDYESIVESEWYTVCDAEGKKMDTFRKESLFIFVIFVEFLLTLRAIYITRKR